MLCHNDTQYRFRILNGCGTRLLDLKMGKGHFWVVGTERSLRRVRAPVNTLQPTLPTPPPPLSSVYLPLSLNVSICLLTVNLAMCEQKRWKTDRIVLSPGERVDVVVDFSRVSSQALLLTTKQVH